MSNTQLTNQQYLDSIEKEYNALLEKGNKGETKLSDEEIDKIAGTLSKAAKEDPMLNYIGNLPSNGGNVENGKMDTTTEEVTVRINPETGERLIVGTPEHKPDNVKEYITDTFEDLWEKAAQSPTTDLNKMEIPDQVIMDHATEQFNLSAMEMNVFLDLVKRYRANDRNIPGLYSKLPPSVKKIVDAGAMESGATNNLPITQLIAAKNNISKTILDSFVSDITMNSAIIDFNTEMNKVMSDANVTIRDMYYDSITDKLNQIDKVIEKVESGDGTDDEKKQKIENLTKLNKALSDAINLDEFREKLPRIKIKKFDIEKPLRLAKDFDNKYISSVYSIHSVTLLWKIMQRVFPEYDQNIITRFILAFCKYTMNMKPDNVFEHTFMYHFVTNIIYLDTNDSSDMENTIKDNIRKCLDVLNG